MERRDKIINELTTFLSDLYLLNDFLVNVEKYGLLIRTNSMSKYVDAFLKKLDEHYVQYKDIISISFVWNFDGFDKWHKVSEEWIRHIEGINFDDNFDSVW